MRAAGAEILVILVQNLPAIVAVHRREHVRYAGQIRRHLHHALLDVLHGENEMVETFDFHGERSRLPPLEIGKRRPCVNQLAGDLAAVPVLFDPQ